MNNKKGFTLSELLAVLVILSLLMTLSFPNLSNLSDTAKSNYDNATKIILRSAASMYVNNNKEEVNQDIQKNGKTCIPIGKLVAYEYLDSEIEDLKGTKMSDDHCIIVTMQSDNNKIRYNYDIQEKTNTPQKATGDYLPPIIKLKNKSSIECKEVMNITNIDEYTNNCEIEVTDNVDEKTSFQNIKLNEEQFNNDRSIKLYKVVNQEQNKVFIIYNATDSSGNKALPLQVQLVLPE